MEDGRRLSWESPLAERPAKRVLLIGWDGADWRMIDPLLERGEMPNLGRFVSGGVMGNIASLTPMLSPILWTSIATGKYGDKHGILGFAEPDGSSGTLRPVSSSSRKCKAIWNILSEQGLRSAVVNWFASHPAEQIDGFVVTDRFPHAANKPDAPWPPVDHSVHPADLLDELCALRVHPAMVTPQQVAPFIPQLGRFDARRDEKVGELCVLLAQCATIHAAATCLMQQQEWDFLAIYYDAIDRFAHAFMEYHPPRAAHVSEEEFERYNEVMKACYRFHDMMLGRLLQLAGDDTAVIIVSDHGFHSDHLRPEGSSKIESGKPVAWHRRYGVLAAKGPGIKVDERVYGASLLDITPTILTMLGCPVARDMDGVALRQIFETTPPAIDPVETYEGGDESGVMDAAEEDPWVAQQMLARLAGLGYIESDSVAGVTLDRARNLGQIYASTGRPRRALDEYQKVLEQRPDDKGAKIACAGCHLQMGQLHEVEQTVREILTDADDAPLANYYLGLVEFRRGNAEAALELMLRAEKTNPDWIELQCQIGQAYLHLQRWADAHRAFERALKIDPDSAEAHDGLGAAYRGQKRPEEAVQEHMHSIALLHCRPQTHIHLGLALAETGQFDWAIRAFEVALEQGPRNPLPHRCLARIYREVRHDNDKAREHLGAARRLAAQRRAAARKQHAQTAELSNDPPLEPK